MKKISKRRIISLFLSLIMIVSSLPLGAFILHAEGDIDYSKHIGCTARFNLDEFSNFLVHSDPATFDYYGSDGELDYDDSDGDGSDWDNEAYWLDNGTNNDDPDIPEDHLLMITDYYLDDESTALWYKVEAADGYELPSKMELNQLYWVFQDFTDPELAGGNQLIIDEKPDDPEFTSTICDEKGNAITEITLPQTEKKTVSVKTTADATVYNQWQVFFADRGIWVDVYKEVSNTLNLSYALLKNVTNSGYAYVRCKSFSAGQEVFSEPLTVKIAYDVRIEIAPVFTGNANAVVDDIMYGDMQVSANDVAVAALETYTITIHYVDEYDNKVFEDHVEVWQAGEYVTHTVTLPFKVGYEAVYGGNVVTKLNMAEHVNGAINEDMELTVVYRPAVVDYVADFFFQNVNDDEYQQNDDLHESIVLSGRTGDITTIEAPQITGFQCLYFDQVKIAADGSTHMEVYYDRLYVLIDFDLGDGGYGCDPVYVRYGSTVAVPAPKRPGFVFEGWEPTASGPNAEGNYTIIVDEDYYHGDDSETYVYKYVALWTATDTKYTVVYWAENANDNDYSYWGSVQYDAVSSSTVSGTDHATAPNNLKDYQYFTYNPEKTLAEEMARTDLVDGKVIVEGDASTIVNVYYSRNVYTITLTDDSVGSCQIEEHVHDESCNRLNCKFVHVHDSTCIKTLICAVPEHKEHTDACIECGKIAHKHNNSCYDCGLSEHAHTSDCCIVDVHAHSIVCYNPNSGYVVASNENGYEGTISQIANPQSGYVYKYRRNNNNYYNYFYDGTTWYYLGTGNQYRGLINSVTNPTENGGYRFAAATKAIACGKVVHDHSSGCAYCEGGVEHSSNADCCTLTEHKHTTGCWENVGNQQSPYNSPANPVEGQVYVFSWGYNVNRYIYIAGEWYTYNGTATNGSVVAPDCDLVSHTHDGTSCQYCCQKAHSHVDSCYVCENEEHEHIDDCYKDVVHTHTDSCYEWSCGEKTHVHHAGCYVRDCGKPAHSHANDPSGSRKIVKIIEAKYGQYIGDEWTFTTKDGYSYPENAGAASWKPEDNDIYSERLALIDIMPGSNLVFYDYPQNNDERYYNYYVECLPDEEADTEYEGVNYRHYLKNGTLTIDFNIYTEAEDFFPIAGFTKYKAISNDRTISNNTNLSDGQTVNFYYTRNEYSLKYYNYNDYIKNSSNNDLTYKLKYKSLLSNYNIAGSNVPYPSTLEPNAYYFAGWYTTPEGFPGTEVDWATMTMPDGDLTIYAKWVPKTHTVKVWLDSEMDVQIGTEQKIDHNKPAHSPGKPPSHGEPGDFDPGKYEDYIFSGWFYLDENGDEKAFSFDNMPVKDDMDVYAKWGSRVPVSYEINFVLGQKDGTGYKPVLDANGDLIYVADPITGKKLAGNAMTFQAKAGTQLYPAYRGIDGKFYFPHTNSHSILMDMDEDKNTATFYYLMEEVPGYRVEYYLDGVLQTDDTKVVTDNDKAVVTETYKVYDGYLPDAYQKTLILSLDEDENVIRFYYTKDDKSAPYRVNYYVEQLDGTYLLQTYDDFVGTIGENVTVPKLTFNGFDYYGYSVGDSVTAIAGDPPPHKLTKDGYLVNLYYNLKEYPYAIYYQRIDDKTNLLEPEIFKDTNQLVKYGQTVTAHAKDIPGYTLISSSSISTVIGVDDYVNPTKNVITFYYTEQQIRIDYVVVDGVGGTLTMPGENIFVMTGEAIGSRPTAALNYEFLGWYMDEACTVKVPSNWIGADNHLNPQADKGASTPYVAATYYAKFGRTTADLVITNNTDKEDVSYIFHVKGNSGTNSQVDLYVSIEGSDSVLVPNVPVGEYTVTLVDSWSFTSDVIGSSNQTVTLDKGDSKELEFENDYNGTDWLSGENHKDNHLSK